MTRARLLRAAVGRRKDHCEANHASEAGDTLIEVLLAVVVLGLASVALIIAFGTTISASSDHRNLSTANTILTSASQQAISLIQQQKSVFENCYTTETATVAAYQANAAIAMTVPAPYTTTYSVAYTEVQYWNGTSFNPVSASGPATPCVPNATQLITITVTENSNGSHYTNSFVVNFPLASSVANASGAATQLVWLTQPSSTTAGGTALTTQPVVAVEDAAGVAVTTDLSPVTLSLTGVLGSLSGCSGNEILGVVTFSGCTVSPNGTYQITATDGTLPAITSNPFTLSGTADQLVFTTQPIAGASGSAFTQYPVVKIEDGSGNVISTTATLTLISSGGIMTGCTGLSTTTGIFNIAGCSFEGGYFYNSANGQYLPTPYTLSATVSGLIPGTSNTFHVSSFGPAAQLNFSTQPTGVASATATSAFTGQPVVTVEDAFGNVVTNFAGAVSLSISSGETLSGCAQSASNGDVTFTGCAGSAYANGVTLTAAGTGLPSVTSAAFNITGVAAKLVFTTSPVAGPSGAALTSQPIITVEDASGNVVTSATLPVALATSGGTLAVCSDLTPISGVITVASCTFAGTVGTSYTMTASMTGLPTATSSSFSPSSSGAATQLVFTTEPVAGYAGGPFSVNPVLKIEDSGGNVATASTATVTLTPSGGVLSGCSGLTSVAGVVNVSNCTFGGLVGTQYLMVASSPGLLQSTSSNFSPSSAGPATQLVYTTAPPSIVVVGTTFPVVVDEQDQFGNIETSDSSTSLSLTANNGGGGFTCSTRPTIFTNGVASFAGCKYTSGSASAFTLTASSGSLTPAAATMTVYGAPTKMVYTTAPPSSVGAGITFTIVANEEDQYGNTETLDSTTAVNLAANNGGGGFTCSTTPTLVTNGVATYGGCSFTIPSVTAYTLTTSSAGLTSATSNTTVSAGPATKLVYTTAPPATALAGATFSVIVHEEDQYGNTETSDSTTALNLAANNGGGGFTCSTNPTVVTAGVATYSGCKYTIASVTAYTLTASSSGLTSATSNTTVSPAVKSKLVYATAPPASTTAGTTFSVVIDEEDQYNNIETADSTTTLSLAAGGGFACGTTPTLVTNGVATFSNCSYTTASLSAYTLTASSSGLTSATSNTTVSAGTATELVYATAPPGTTTAGTAFSVIVNEEDQFGNIATGDSSTMLSLAAGGGFACLSTPTHVTNGVAGFTNCSYTISSATAYTLTASSSGLTSATSNTTVNPASKSKLVYATAPPSSTTAGATFSVVVNEEDQYNNIETADSTTTLALAANNGGGGFACLTTPAHVTNGVATFSNCSYTIASTTAFTLTASSAGITSATSNTTVSAGAATSIALTGCSSGVASGATCVATATLKDADGNVETGNSTGVSFTKTTGSGSVNGLTGVTSFTNGVANVTLTGNLVGSVTIEATGDTFTSNLDTFNVTPGSAAKVVFTTQPGNGISGSALAIQPVVKVEDAAGNIVTTSSAPVTLTLNTSSGAGTLSGCSATTTSGVASFAGCDVAVTTDGTFTLTAASTGLTPATSSTFTATGAATQLLFTTQPSNGVSATALATQPVVTVEDAAGHPVVASAATITLTKNQVSGTGTLSGCTGAVAPVNGVATYSGCIVTLGTDGAFTLTATQTGLTGTSANFTVTGAASKVVFSTQPGNGTSGSTLTTQPVAMIEDAAGNTVVTSSAPVTLSVNAVTGAGTLSGCSATTTNGFAVFSGCTMTVTTSGTFTLTAASSGLASATSSAFTVNLITQTINWTPPGAQTWGTGAVTLGGSGPIGGTSASFPGTTGSSIYTTTAYNDPSSFSTSFWFKTSTSGAIAGATNVQSSLGAANYDRQLWIDSAGHLVFGLYSPNVSGSYSEVTSPGVYDNGVWHQVVATYGAAGQDLYVDGTLVASSAAGISGQNYVFYWHLGFAQTTSWADGSVAQYFTGSLAQAALYLSQLTQSQVTALYGAATTSAESTLILADSADSYWPLTNAVGTTVFPDQSSGPLNTGYVEGVFSLGTATDSAGTTVTFASSTPSVCTVSGTIVTEVTSGTCTITPTAPASGNYATTVGTASNITVNPN